MSHTTLFTSESVCQGHPDKICDQISDAILDSALQKDPQARVAVETLVTANQIVLAGEVSCAKPMEYSQLARNLVASLGYDDEFYGFSDRSPVFDVIHAQSPEIAVGVDRLGAGDQGMMFGYACQETPELMPLPIMIAHALARAVDDVRNTQLSYLRPDGKTQVTVRYENHKPIGIEKVVIAAPHDQLVDLPQVVADLFRLVVQPTIAGFGLAIKPTQVIVNGTGVWHQGGPAADTGLTGRKIVVDTYGGYARVGGGCFSGKDPTKVDRTGAYAARFLAKQVVAAGLAKQAEVALAYCIGQAQPVMKTVETFGSNKKSDQEIQKFIDSLLDCSVAGIVQHFDLRRPIYQATAAYGHFGRPEFPWEQVVV